MLKVIYVASRGPQISLGECHQHWFEVHGALHVSAGHKMLGYVQHHTLLAAYADDPKPTHDGASIIWAASVPALIEAHETAAWRAATEDNLHGVHGGRALFDENMPIAVAAEHVVLEGKTNPLMVKAIWLASRHPGVPEAEFLQHWRHVHGAIAAKVPGVRRYVQNHPVADSRSYPPVSHDGWSEMWFDDYDAYRRAIASPEWAAVIEDGDHGLAGGNRPLFDFANMCFVLGRERPMMQPRQG